MRRDISRTYGRISGHDRDEHIAQDRVLCIVVRRLVFAFELDTYRKVVATAALAKTGFACMPGPTRKWDKLQDFTVPAYQQVRGHLEARISLKYGCACQSSRF